MGALIEINVDFYDVGKY